MLHCKYSIILTFKLSSVALFAATKTEAQVQDNRDLNERHLCLFSGSYWLFLFLSVTSKQPPMITKFLEKDLIKPDEVNRKTGFKLPCEASGTNLTWTWKRNDKKINLLGRHYSLLENGTLIGQLLSASNGGYYQCFVKDEETGVEVFSRRLIVSVTGNY